MKCKIPEISWHNRDPVLSVDIQPNSNVGTVAHAGNYRLASGGTDAHVLIWSLTLSADGADMKLDLVADLTRHQRAVNVVKWSPNGELLASGDDESVIFIWRQKAENDVLNIVDVSNEQDKEIWLTWKILRGHMEDVYDLSWSLNSQFLVSGSVDNTAMLWDVSKGKSMGILRDHKGFVQGVAWDPMNQFIATLSTDRFLRIFDIQSKRVLHRINKSTLPVLETHELHKQRVNLFHDDTLQTYFRRLCFTPDGKLLLTPAGVLDIEGGSKLLHTSYAFSRYALRQPALMMNSPEEYTVAISCCPLLFRLRKHTVKAPPLVPLPYRMIYAIATRYSIYFYDTQQSIPFAVISHIHYTRLTDISWSSDGHVVIASSTDGFCSLITFEAGELGELYEDAAAVFQQLQDLQTNAKKTKKLKENEPVQLKPKAAASTTATTTTENATLEKNANEQTDIKQPNVDSSSDSTNSITALLSTNILKNVILEREVLSSAEKFESPEKKAVIATPISVRHYPRTPNSASISNSKTEACNTTPTSTFAFAVIRDAAATGDTAADTSPVSSKCSTNLSNESKIATPIAIRRTRLLDEQTAMEEQPTTVVAAPSKSPMTTSHNKTPRRVALTTLSTPKSKKKLLN